MGQHVFDDSNEQSTSLDGPRAFVTGWPVWHSRSPMIHGSWLKEYGLSGSYERVGVPPEEFADFLAGLASSGYVGGNVTIPHKETAYAAVSRCDAAADAIGAVNTLWLEDGHLVGGNTDAHGFSANLDERLPGWADAQDALVLGAGGAARAVVYSLLSRGVAKVRLVNRTLARAEAMAATFDPRVSAHAQEETEALFRTADLVVNTVPPQSLTAEEERMGMRVPLPDLSALCDHAMVTDIVYVPVETPILQAAAARGLRHADGLGMLLHQAVPGFERWFGVLPAVTASLYHAIAADIALAG